MARACDKTGTTDNVRSVRVHVCVDDRCITEAHGDLCGDAVADLIQSLGEDHCLALTSETPGGGASSLATPVSLRQKRAAAGNDSSNGNGSNGPTADDLAAADTAE